ncbi:MAG TPA: M28 family peptidase [Bacteroides sp.]|nr:M28 family peptidase [Bacteroides sp.]
MQTIISNHDAGYALEIIRKICKEAGPGLPGSSQERERALMIQEELESHLGSENVTAEEFKLAPWAFISSYPISASLMLLSALLNISADHITGTMAFLSTLTALLLSLCAPLFFLVEFVLGNEFIDPLFRKKRSVNVIGTLRKPGTKKVRRLLIISGHHDSAPENTWLRILGYGFFILSGTFFIGLITTLVMNTIQFAGLISGNNGISQFGTIGPGLMIYPVVPSFIFAFFFYRGRKYGGVVPGAADNLSASALVVALCRYLVNHPSCIPDETEIRFISFGSEEAGCRGSKRYVRRHLDELKLLDTRQLNIETVAYPLITILTSDINGTVKNSPELIKNLTSAAERSGVPYKVKPAYLGVSNDSGPFSQAGIKAATLLSFKMPQQFVAFYHQKWDVPENLTLDPLCNMLRLSLEWLRAAGDYKKKSGTENQQDSIQVSQI